MKEVNLKVAFGVVLLIVCFFVGVGYSQSSRRTNLQYASDYDHAPYCTVLSDPTSILEPCSYAAVQVVRKHIISHNRRSDEYSIDLQTANGRSRSVGIYHSLYQPIEPGSVLTAQSWRGEICSLGFQNQWYQTNENPDLRTRDSDLGLYSFYYIAGAFTLVLAIYWQKQWKLLQSGAVPTASEYPLVRDDD